MGEVEGVVRQMMSRLAFSSSRKELKIHTSLEMRGREKKTQKHIFFGGSGLVASHLASDRDPKLDSQGVNF